MDTFQKWWSFTSERVDELFSTNFDISLVEHIRISASSSEMFASVSGRIRADKRGQAAGQAKPCSRPGSRSGSSLLRSVKSSRQGSEDIMNTRLGLVLALVMAGQEENP